MVRQVSGFVLHVADRISADELELSITNSQCTASSYSLGREIEDRLRPLVIRFVARVKSLGAGLGASTRRNMQVASSRLRAFRQRIPRFRRLSSARVDTSRLLRTGANSALTYGQAILGVATSVLLSQRRAAAAAAAPSSGTAGQNLDLALILADGSRSGRADPAYEAHKGPIGKWANAVWER